MIYAPGDIRRQYHLYLLSTFCSSLGSMTFIISMPAFLAAAGVDAVKIGILFGAIRLNSVFVNALFGHLGDRWSPRKIVMYSELIAVVGSGLIFYFYTPLSSGDSWFWCFLAANQLRTFFTNFQAASVQKLGKLFDTELKADGATSLRLNRVTFGSVLFASIISYLFFKTASFGAVIVFDAVTFILNGIVIALLTVGGSSPDVKSGRTGINIQINFLQYWKILPILAFADVLLAAAFSGQNTLNTRLVGDRLELVPVLAGIFGAMVWISSSFISRAYKAAKVGAWVLAAAGLFLQFYSQSPGFVLVGAALGYLGYWLVYNLVGQEIMRSAPTQNYATIAASRNVLIVLVLGAGEFWIGAGLFPLSAELLIRSGVCIVGFMGFAQWVGPKNEKNLVQS